MSSKWETYSKQGLSFASAATSVGFSAARIGTKLGFGAARSITTTVVGLAGTTVDYALFGVNMGTGPVLGGAVSAALSLAEQLALAPILLGETVTSTSLVAAQSSLDALSAIFPGSDEASFSLASFVTLARREWNEPVLGDQLPEERYSLAEVARALVAWGVLQGVTQEWQERRWFSTLREIHVDDAKDVQEDAVLSPEISEQQVHVTDDTMLPEDDGQILTADIGDAPSSSAIAASMLPPAGLSSNGQRRVSDAQLKSTLRRLSKMVLAGYGGAGLIFFGVSFTPTSAVRAAAPSQRSQDSTVNEQTTLTDVVAAAEHEASASAAPPPRSPKSYSWWNVLLGRHDQDIFEGYAFTPDTDAAKGDKGKKRMRPSTAVVGSEHRMPRYWVLTDHGRRQIVLVFRGTMSFNELAVDLTCEPAEFAPAYTSSHQEEEDAYAEIPGGLNSPPSSPPHSPCQKQQPETYDVHSGMLRMARVMGARGKPVHSAVRSALRRNRGYELVLCGHSLGAGVAALLALTWADPKTCLTVRSSGLPIGRRVSAFCFAPPCVASPALCALSSNLITSFVYSHDIVSRLSLGSVRDMNRAAVWLCNGKNGEGHTGVTKRALKWNAGYGAADDPDWFLSVRKTLEANMHMAHQFPLGRVLWAVRDGDLHPAHRLDHASSSDPAAKVRLFDVLDVETVFSQIVFARDMLSSHLPDRYDRVLHELL